MESAIVKSTRKGPTETQPLPAHIECIQNVTAFAHVLDRESLIKIICPLVPSARVSLGPLIPADASAAEKRLVFAFLLNPDDVPELEENVRRILQTAILKKWGGLGTGGGRVCEALGDLRVAMSECNVLRVSQETKQYLDMSVKNIGGLSDGINFSRMIQLSSYDSSAPTVIKDIIDGRRVPSGDAEKFGARRMLALMFAPLAASRLEKAKVIRSGDHLTTTMAAEILLDTAWGKELATRLNTDQPVGETACNGVLPSKKRGR